jgi:hypothetical protein
VKEAAVVIVATAVKDRVLPAAAKAVPVPRGNVAPGRLAILKTAAKNAPSTIQWSVNEELIFVTLLNFFDRSFPT